MPDKGSDEGLLTLRDERTAGQARPAVLTFSMPSSQGI